MIGPQKTGRLDGVTINATAHEGLMVRVNGKPGRLAVVTEDGQVVAAGLDVAREVRAVAVNCYQAMWRGQGHLKHHSTPPVGA